MQHTIPLTPVDAVEITVLVDNTTDMMLANGGPAHRPVVDTSVTPFRPAAVLEGGETFGALRAEHGFSALLDISIGGRKHRLLFDTGVTPDGMVENMRWLGLDPGDIEAVVLSHGHYDHTTGLDGMARALGRVNLPVLIHPEFWGRRRITLPGREPWDLPTTSKSALEGVGFEIVEERQPSFLLDGAMLVTGEVDRTTAFEKGLPGHETLRDQGEWRPDPEVLDDQALVMNIRGEGLLVLTGCGHAGIVNTVRHAQRLTGVQRIHSVVGGFHLSGSYFEALIPQTCRAIAAMEPTFVVPGHCTGWRAVHALAAAMPDAFVQSTVGTRFQL